MHEVIASQVFQHLRRLPDMVIACACLSPRFGAIAGPLARLGRGYV
jgi:hypothetical protein